MTTARARIQWVVHYIQRQTYHTVNNNAYLIALHITNNNRRRLTSWMTYTCLEVVLTHEVTPRKPCTSNQARFVVLTRNRRLALLVTRKGMTRVQEVVVGRNGKSISAAARLGQRRKKNLCHARGSNSEVTWGSAPCLLTVFMFRT